MTKMLENEMVTPKADHGEPQEQDPDEAYDQSRVDELRTIGRLHSITSEIEELTESLRSSLLGKSQAE